MQATAPSPQRDLARELKSAREACQYFASIRSCTINDANGSSISNFDNFSFFFGECLKKNSNAPRPSDISQIYNIFRLLIGVPDYRTVLSRMEENRTCRK